MKPFQYHTASSVQDALQRAVNNSAYLAGGTNQVDLMKKHITEPDTVIAVSNAVPNTLELDRKGLLLGAATTNSAVAGHPGVQKQYPLLSQALLAGASPQIRNMATTGGNLLQRTRCPYFYDTAMPCNKRKPESGCGALNGHQRMAGIVGTSTACVAVHPSDFCVALAALDAEVHITEQNGTTKTILFTDFHRLPGNTPQLDNTLPDKALIHAVFVPKNKFQKHSAYVKIRERDSYAFALVSVAAALVINGGRIKVARLASGGVAHKPWRWEAAERFLENKLPNPTTFEQAAKIAISETSPLQHNAFKVSLLEGAITTALLRAVSEDKG